MISSRKILAITALSLGLGLGGIHASNAAELVTNGGFETGDFSGWTQSGNTGFTSVSSSASTGAYGAAFGPIGSIGYLTQELTTVAGSLYTLTFDLQSSGASGTSQTSFAVSEAGNTLLSLPSAFSFAYTHITETFVALSNSTTLTFAFRNDPDYFLLDNVSVQGLSSGAVTAVPGPTAGAGLGAFALAGLGFLAFRRKKAQVAAA